MSKIWYRVAPGVMWVNGAPVPEDRRVSLSKAEAAFDIGQGRISPEKATHESHLPARKPRTRRARPS